MANLTANDPVADAYERGRRVGLAAAALALSVTAYINLLGIEKSLLAIALALVALRGRELAVVAQRHSRIALGLASVHAVTVIVLVAIYAEKLTALGRQIIATYHSLS